MVDLANPSPYEDWDQYKNNALILVLNCGSSSIKISLFYFNGDQEYRLLDGHLKEMHSQSPELKIQSSRLSESIPITHQVDVKEGLNLLFDFLTKKLNLSLEKLAGIGHRFVHGGPHYRSTLRATAEILSNLEQLSYLAPLHNNACLAGIQTAMHLCPNTPQIIVFDTTFHQNLPQVASKYPIPSSINPKQEIMKYGFHGISHHYIWSVYQKNMKGKAQNDKIITLHLGNGCSITAISDGISIDTSMGFTPAEGLMMGTRAGDIDADIMEFICRQYRKSSEEVMNVLNYKSGLLGVSEVSSDIKELLKVFHENKKAAFAIELFCYQIVKYLGAYLAVLGGAKAFIFSGGIGENSPQIREMIIKKMEWMGIQIDVEANQNTQHLNPGQIDKISGPHSTVSIYVIATDENIAISREVQRFLV